MRLKRVKIFGFKTFADRTEFDLHGNLIAVVGPNGCGKSNLVDAILWGLGEGNARHLRAQSGQDVIFSGSARRKPIGFAEVNLLFDNEDGLLPVQSSEVSVTRRLNRSGESEYYINRQSCRLRDVFDLLADSGLGRSGYSIVGQKEIDQALAASAEDRRAWVDEAAGVQRYRVRKLESLKRMSSAKDHLSRIADILSEIEVQREPLKEEAEAAIRYKSILASLREVESGLLIVEVAKATKEVREMEERVSESARLAKSEMAVADAAEDQISLGNERVRSLDTDLDRVRETRQSNLTAAERAEAAVHLGEQKLATLSELEKNLGEEAELLKCRILEAESEVSGLGAELEAEQGKLVKIREECAGAGDEARSLREQLRSLDAELAQAREFHNRKLKQDAELAHRQGRIKDLKRELAGVQQSLPDLVTARSEAQASRDAVAAKLIDAENAVLEARNALNELERRVADEAQQGRRRLAERASLEGKRQGIEATIDAHEGLNQGAKAVLDAKKRGILSGDYIPVGEALDVKKEHATAIETALGGAVNDLIVESEADAKTAIEHLKANRLGRATFQPLSLIRSHEPGADLRKLLNQPSVVGRASELVECKNAYRPVFESLLGRILVVADLNTALRLAKTSGWNRIVTLDGEVVHSGGAVTGGIAAKAGYGLVQRRADLSQTIAELRKLDVAVAEADRQGELLGKERAAIQESIDAHGAAAQEIQGELKDAKEWFHNIENELGATERSAHKLNQELEDLKLKESEDIPAVDLASVEARRDELLAVLAARNADADSAVQRLREAEERAKQAETRLEIGHKRLLAANENERLRERRISNLGPERERAGAEIERGKSELARATAAKEAAEAELAGLQNQKAKMQSELSALGDAARSARSHAQACTEAAHQAELTRARTDTRRAGLLQRLIEDYNVGEDEAMDQAPGIELPKDASTLVNRLRRDLKAMGDVNLGAVEAYERLTTRWDELTLQSEDVASGITQIEACIHELDKLTRERFVDTFAQVQAAFADIFSRLFDGGHGRLFLTDEQNILESGVEIDVLLPGKKRQRLELLSGGERSLCATSFLFALLRVKPSPLVILDEVDAPLDGRNVERFLALLHDFTAVTQFILITHNPTTIESAPIWLGVTMDEPGVSTLVPVRFTSQIGEREAVISQN